MDRITRNPDGEVRILFRMLERIDQSLPVEDVDVDVVRAVFKVSAENLHEIFDPLLRRLPQGVRRDRKGVRNPVAAVLIGELRNRVERSERAVFLAVVHRVRAGGVGFALLPAVRRRAGLAAVHHVRGDGQRREGVLRVAVSRGFLEVRRYVMEHFLRDQVHAVVVVPKLREVALHLKVADIALFVADHLHLRIFDRAERVGDDRKPRHAKRHQPLDVGVVQRHLNLLVGVFVVHIVDDVHRVDIEVAEPLAVEGETLHHLVVIQDVALERLHLRPNLSAGVLVVPAVHRKKQELGQVASRAEELHLLSDLHGRNAAGDRVVVAVNRAHQVVALILNRVGVDRNLRAEPLKVFGKLLRPEDGEVRFGRRAEVVKGVENPVGVFGDERNAVFADAADRLGDPHRVAPKQLVVLGRAQMARHPQLHHHVVHQFLRRPFGEDAADEVALDVNIEEGADPSQRHRRAVLLLNRGEIGEVHPLDRLPRVFCRAAHVVTVHRGHFLEPSKEGDLLIQLFEKADVVLPHPVFALLRFVLFLFLDQLIHAVERNPAVVADDSPTAISVRKPGQDADLSRGKHLVGVDAENALVVGGAVGKLFEDALRHLIAVFLTGLLRHPHAAERVDPALKRAAGLEADDQFIFLVEIAGLIMGQRGDMLGVDRKHAAEVALHLEQVVELLHQLAGPFGWAGEKRRVPLVDSIVFLNEIADVDLFLPVAGPKAFPFRKLHSHLLLLPKNNKKTARKSILLQAAQTVGIWHFMFPCGAPQ